MGYYILSIGIIFISNKILWYTLNTKYRDREILLKRIIKWFIILFLIVVLIMSLAGIYKFNYLANTPGFDADGNKIKTHRTER